MPRSHRCLCPAPKRIRPQVSAIVHCFAFLAASNVKGILASHSFLSTRKNRVGWELVEETMVARGFMRTACQCRHKWNNMKQDRTATPRTRRAAALDSLSPLSSPLPAAAAHPPPSQSRRSAPRSRRSTPRKPRASAVTSPLPPTKKERGSSSPDLPGGPTPRELMQLLVRNMEALIDDHIARCEAKLGKLRLFRLLILLLLLFLCAMSAVC